MHQLIGNFCRRFFQTSQRSLKQVLTKAMRIKHEEYYKRIDGIPAEFELIYKLPLDHTMSMGKLLTVGTMIVIPSAYAYNMYTERGISDMDFLQSIAVNKDELGYFIGAILATNIILYRVCHISIPRVYRHQKK